MQIKSQTATPPLLIVTDLDGTLLDHDSYSLAEARPALARAAAAGIEVIPNTSKTAAELLPLRQAMASHAPFVVENGSAICLPAGDPLAQGLEASGSEGLVEVVLGCGISTIRQQLQALKSRFRFASFADWNLDTLIARTGLPAEAARAAAERRFSEPLVWQDTPAALEAFLNTLEANGLHALQGGRFLSVLGQGADKGRALDRLRQLYRDRLGIAPRVIALGDSGNDLAMLQAADIAVIIHNPASTGLQLQGPEVIRSQAAGPAGWNEVIQQLLDRFHIP